jgi:hypothetical protein
MERLGPPCRRTLLVSGTWVALVGASLVPSIMHPDGAGRSGRFIVDALEDRAWANLEDASGRSLHVPRGWLPERVQEGDLLRVDVDREAAEAHVRFRIDAEATRARREELGARRDRLPRAPSGDLDL